MAYTPAQKKQTGNSFNTNTVKKETTQADDTIFNTGLFASDKGSALASVRLKEALTIPAGSFINLYEVDADRRTESGPVYRIQVRNPPMRG